MSSGKIRTGVSQFLTKSLSTVKTKSAPFVYILLRNSAAISKVISGLFLIKTGAHPFYIILKIDIGVARYKPAWMNKCRTNHTVVSSLQQVPYHRSTNAKTKYHHELFYAQFVHQRELVFRKTIPSFLNLKWSNSFTVIGIAEIKCNYTVFI